MSRNAILQVAINPNDRAYTQFSRIIWKNAFAVSATSEADLDIVPCVLWVPSSTEPFVVQLIDDSTVTINNRDSGILPLWVTRVYDSPTPPSGILAFY